MSSPADDSATVSRTLARKAAADATAVREFAGNAEITDEIIGFHAQQAVEKWLKAIIARRGEGFEHTHDLHRLAVLAVGTLDGTPFDIDEVLELTQYSVPLRYEDLLDAEPLDRDATVSLVKEVGEWVEVQISRSEKDEPDDRES